MGKGNIVEEGRRGGGEQKIFTDLDKKAQFRPHGSYQIILHSNSLWMPFLSLAFSQTLPESGSKVSLYEDGSSPCTRINIQGSAAVAWGIIDDFYPHIRILNQGAVERVFDLLASQSSAEQLGERQPPSAAVAATSVTGR
jgi:hypothetical protein